MSTVITWSVTAMDCYPNEGGNTDVVFNVHWTCSGADGDYTGSVYSTCAVPGPGDPFTPYADLTQDQVLGWLWANGIDKAGTEAAVLAQIETSKNPPITKPPLPWL